MAKAPVQKIVLTYEDYLHFPNDGRRYEILEGEVYVSPAPTTKHQTVVGNVFARLLEFVKRKKLGRVFVAPTDVVLSRTNVVQPDVLFLSNERLSLLTERNVQGAPDLIVEVLSEFTEEQDRTLKPQIYARHGVKEYWLIDPDRETLEQYELDPESRELRHAATYQRDETLRSKLLPGLALRLTELWE